MGNNTPLRSQSRQLPDVISIQISQPDLLSIQITFQIPNYFPNSKFFQFFSKLPQPPKHNLSQIFQIT